MRIFNFSVSKFATILFLLSVLVAFYIFYTTLYDGIEQRETKTQIHPNFVSFCDRSKPDWLKMISSSLKTLDYFHDHLDDMVTDVAVGSRIMEAQLNILLKSKLDLSPSIMEDLKTLQRRANSLGDAIYQTYYQLTDNSTDPGYVRLRKNLQWIEKSSTWETPNLKQWKTLMPDNTVIVPSSNIDMRTDFGKLSDGCIFGTFENCATPDYCIDFCWREAHSGYKLTHQILFHYMMGRNKCFSGERKAYYESQNLVDPNRFLEHMCRLVLTETQKIELMDYPFENQDLFVEQILVCSLAGYNDFLTRHWTNVILNWSGVNGVLGCYTERQPNEEQLESDAPKRRVKRWDNIFEIEDEQCSAHMGALILGVIGQQLRYYVEVCHQDD